MLRPPQIQVKDYPVATKALLGFEQQLYVTTQPYTDLGLLAISAPNSGTYTASQADNALLAAAPQELLLVNETTALVGDSPLVVQVLGTDANNNPLSGVATFVPPGYAADQSYDITAHRAVEIIPWQGGVTADGHLFKTITAVNPITASAAYANSSFRVIGVPSIASYNKVGMKISLEYDPKLQSPTAIQDGKDMSAQIKPGIIPVGVLTISTKDPVSSDGMRRYMGQNLTGLVKEVKQDRLATQYIFLCQLYMTAKPKGSEGEQPVTLEASAMYQRIGAVIAPGTVNGGSAAQ